VAISVKNATELHKLEMLLNEKVYCWIARTCCIAGLRYTLS
jgi:hypothetical protein